jgi:hypothetical protein
LSEQQEGLYSYSVVKEFIQQRLVPDEYEYLAPKIWTLQMDPKNKMAIFLKNARKILIKKSIIFWDTTPCSPLIINRHFGGTHRLHIQAPRISRARNQRENRWQAALRLVPPKRRLTFNGPHDDTTQKTVFFTTTAA